MEGRGGKRREAKEAEVEDSESSASPKGWEARSLPTTGSTRAQTWHYKFARRLLQVYRSKGASVCTLGVETASP